MNNTAYKIKVMQAHLDGKDVESNAYGDDCWRVAFEPTWDWLNRNYRIKEEKPDIKVDPYVGKIAIHKRYKGQFIIQKCLESVYIIHDVHYMDIESIKKDWYIQGEDF